MKNFKLLSAWLKQVKINSQDCPVDHCIQLRLNQYWNDHTGVYAAYTKPFLFNSGRLVIFCDSAIWVNQLRHQIPSLILHLSKNKFSVNEISVKLKSFSESAANQPPKQTNKVSSNTAQAIEKSSMSLTNNTLKKSMQKLARRLKKISQEE